MQLDSGQYERLAEVFRRIGQDFLEAADILGSAAQNVGSGEASRTRLGRFADYGKGYLPKLFPEGLPPSLQAVFDEVGCQYLEDVPDLDEAHRAGMRAVLKVNKTSLTLYFHPVKAGGYRSSKVFIIPLASGMVNIRGQDALRLGPPFEAVEAEGKQEGSVLLKPEDAGGGHTIGRLLRGLSSPWRQPDPISSEEAGG